MTPRDKLPPDHDRHQPRADIPKLAATGSLRVPFASYPHRGIPAETDHPWLVNGGRRLSTCQATDQLLQLLGRDRLQTPLELATDASRLPGSGTPVFAEPEPGPSPPRASVSPTPTPSARRSPPSATAVPFSIARRREAAGHGGPASGGHAVLATTGILSSSVMDAVERRAAPPGSESVL